MLFAIVIAGKAGAVDDAAGGGGVFCGRQHGIFFRRHRMNQQGGGIRLAQSQANAGVNHAGDLVQGLLNAQHIVGFAGGEIDTGLVQTGQMVHRQPRHHRAARRGHLAVVGRHAHRSCFAVAIAFHEHLFNVLAQDGFVMRL